MREEIAPSEERSRIASFTSDISQMLIVLKIMDFVLVFQHLDILSGFRKTKQTTFGQITLGVIWSPGIRYQGLVFLWTFITVLIASHPPTCRISCATGIVCVPSLDLTVCSPSRLRRSVT